MTRKYRLTESHFDKRGNAYKLEGDGYSRQEITNAFYKATDGAPLKEQKRLYEKFYDRCNTPNRKAYNKYL